jgi:hypothetical protein
LPLETVARRRPGRLTVVLTVDGVETPPRRRQLLRRLGRLLVRPAQSTATPAGRLDEVVRRCAALGAEVVTLDRPNGRNYGRTHKRVVARPARRSEPAQHPTATGAEPAATTEETRAA